MLPKAYSLIMPLALLLNCSSEVHIPNLDSEVSSPVAIETTADKSHFLILNGNYSHRHEGGSILFVDNQGEKKGRHLTPRLGRTLTVAGNDVLVSFDQEVKSSDAGLLHLYKISQDNTGTPSLTLNKSWKLSQCIPLAVAARTNYPYFAMTCANGSLMVGELKDERANSTLTLVRKYPLFARSALHIDPKRNLILAFTTNIGTPLSFDTQSLDQITLEDEANLSEKENDIPDVYERKQETLKSVRDRGSSFQFIHYDIAAANASRDEEGHLPLILKEEQPDLIASEQRWLYFSLLNADSTPDEATKVLTKELKYYRTNFSAAIPHPHDPDSFYLAHRGSGTVGKSEHANNILQVTFKNDSRTIASTEALSPNHYHLGALQVPQTKSFFNIKRVYGHKGTQQHAALSYPTKIATGDVDGEPVLLVNDFRDLDAFPTPYYSISAVTLNDSPWFEQISSQTIDKSYFDIAFGQAGRALVSSVYDHSVILLDLKIGSPITSVKVIR